MLSPQATYTAAGLRVRRTDRRSITRVVARLVA